MLRFLISKWLFFFIIIIIFILLCRLEGSVSPSHLCFPSHPLYRRRGHVHAHGQRYKLCSYLSPVIGLERIF